FSSRRRHTRFSRDWSSDVCSSDLQPAIWMGDYGYVSLAPGIGAPKLDRELPFRHATEIATPYYYAVDLEPPEGKLRAELTATERSEERRVGKECRRGRSAD